MDLTTCYCRNQQCKLYGRSDDAARLQPRGTHRGAVRFQCLACGHRISGRTGTAYAGIRSEESRFRLGATLLAEGMSLRATSRALQIDKDTACDWLRRASEHCDRLVRYFFRNLHITECQLDELWTFILKKEEHLTPLEQLNDIYGDAWVWITFVPAWKLVPSWVVGKRTTQEAIRLIKRFKSTTDGHIPFFTSDELPHYAEALLQVYGTLTQPKRKPGPGRSPSPRLVPPSSLLYAVVVKKRKRSHVTEVSKRIVYGSPQQIEAMLKASSFSSTINTSGVERNNLTTRQHSRRLTRKVNAFSKDQTWLERQLALSFAYYHFVVPHRSLRCRLKKFIRTKGKRGSPKKWMERTPAMATGLTDHIWTMDELLSFRVPPESLW